MKNLLIRALVVLGGMVFADQKSFVQAYDTGKFDEAAKQVEGLDITNSGVARRLGVMYYSAKGVERDQAKGLALLEQAMMAGDATAAVNLVKIYFKIEKNSPKAAWCLMVAEGLKDTSVKDDVVKLRGYFGDDYIKEVTSYIAQLRDHLSRKQEAFTNRMAQADREHTALSNQIKFCQDEVRKKDEVIAHEREEFKSVKTDLIKKLVAAEKAKTEAGRECMELSKKIRTCQEEALKKDEAIAHEREEFNSVKTDLGKKLAAAEKAKTEVGRECAVLAKRIKSCQEEVKKKDEAIAHEREEFKSVKADFDKKLAATEKMVAERNRGLTALANQMKSFHEESPKKDEAVFARYKKRGDKNIEAAGKYNRMHKFNDNQPRTIFRGKNTHWLGRGLRTVCCSPFNFLRTIPAAREIYWGLSEKTVRCDGYSFFVAVASAPVTFCCEIVPTVCDFGNGLIDVVSLGTYGDWLYSGHVESHWYKRNNSHFPWIDGE